MLFKPTVGRRSGGAQSLPSRCCGTRSAPGVWRCNRPRSRLDAWRLFAGIGIGVEFVTIDTYLSELVPKEAARRGVRAEPDNSFLRLSDRRLPLLGAHPRDDLRLRRMALGRVCRSGAGAIVVWWLRLGQSRNRRAGWRSTAATYDAERIISMIENRVQGRDRPPAAAARRSPRQRGRGNPRLVVSRSGRAPISPARS